MLQFCKIETLDAPELRPYRTMRRQHEQREQGIFVAEGEKVVRRLLQSRLTVLSVLMPEKWLPDLEPLIRARSEEILAFVADKKLLETLTGFSMYQGLLAVAKVPPQPSISEILSSTPRPHLLAAVDGLSSAENMGAVVRNCAGFGLHGLLVGETCSSPFLRRAVRNSMGTVFELPVVETANLAQALRDLRDRGIHCLAAHPRADQRRLSQADFKGDCCLVFGSEGYGISAPVLEVCNEPVAIRMPPNIDSLNVASAAAVFMYEAQRQRGTT